MGDNDTDHDDQFPTPRRTVLKAAAVTSALAGAGTVLSAQEGEEADADVVLGGDIDAWHGAEPEAIDGVENPTLELDPGDTYMVAWENLDGLPHNFVVIDGDGNEIVRTPIVEEQGFVQTVTFEATEGMTEYFCEVHPRTMRGDIDTGVDDEGDRERIPEGESVGLRQVAGGLSSPLGFAVAPGEADRQYVVDQPGQVYVLTDDGLREEPFLDIEGRLVDLGIEELHGYDERGLLGITFHPDYQENGRAFVRYSAPVADGDEPAERDGTPTPTPTPTPVGNVTVGGADGDEADEVEAAPVPDHVEVLSEFRIDEEGRALDPDSERIVLEIPSPQDNHNGGAIAFGPDDGYLYVSMGDGGDADDTGPGHVDDWYEENDGGNGQDTTENLLGGILRIDVDDGGDGDRAYGIPDDNPLVDLEGHLDEYYAWGFRNPWRMSFDGQGRLFVGDAGQNRYEEVSLVQKGGNYGWNVKEATHCFSPANPNQQLEDCPDRTPDDVRGGEPLIDPIIEYRHRLSTTAFIDGSVVIGGYVYEADTIDHLQGNYVFGNWSGAGVREPDGELFVATPPDEGNGESQSDQQGSNQSRTIELGGEIGGWTGRSPPEIEDEENPRLTLTVGETYEVTWENVDGEPHNFAVRDEDDEPIVQTDITSEEGATQTVTFEATEEMATYVCEVHPTTMQGDVRLEEGETSTATPTETPEGTPTETPEEPRDDATVDRDEDIDPEPELWSLEELTVAGSDDGTLGEYVYAFGRDARGELYVLTSEDFTPFGESGKVYEIVPAGEGDDIEGREGTPEPDDGNEAGTAPGGNATDGPAEDEGGGT